MGQTSEKQKLKVDSINDFEIDDITVENSDENVATVTYSKALGSEVEYTIKAVGEGSADIYFKTVDSVVQSGKITVTVSKNIDEITFTKNEDISLALGKKDYTGKFNVETLSGEAVDVDSLTAVSENESVASVTISENLLGDFEFTVKALAKGETYIYIKANDEDVTSDKLRVIVKEPEKPTQPPTQPSTQAPTKAPKSENSGDYYSGNTNNYSGGENSDNDSYSYYDDVQDEPQGTIVYITPTGKRYHYLKSCAGKNAIATTLADAQTRYTPCKKCAM